jgi:hypothetical protein
MYPTDTANAFKIQSVVVRAGGCEIQHYWSMDAPVIEFHGPIDQALTQHPKAQALATRIKELVDAYNTEG